MRKIFFLCLTIVLSIALASCNSTSYNTEKNEEPTNEAETPNDNENEANSEDEIEELDTNIKLHTSSSETVHRTIEGMDEEVEVINYEILPYGISYQLDETFGTPEVNDNEITYSTQNDEYQIMIKVMNYTDLEKVVSDLQATFESEEYEYKGELENLTLEDNEIKGNRQSFGYPIHGFYAFQIDEHVLVITYLYPEEARDGMGPLLDALSKSIDVQ